MKTTAFEPLLRDATIKAIDGVTKKLAKAEDRAETRVNRLLAHWEGMEKAEKEHVVGIAIATITTAVTAIVALRARSKSPLKQGKKIVKKVARKVF